MNRAARDAAAVALLAAGLAAGCASALREPPTLEQLTAVAGPNDRDPARLRLEAARAFESRELQPARESVRLWLQVAKGETGVEALIEVARVRCWLAGKEPEETARRAAALGAVQAAQLCGRRAPQSIECTYWLAVGLGVQARERRGTALDALPRIVELLEAAIAERPAMDHGGPQRVLALVLVRAPGWPGGVGDPDRALVHAREAVRIDPEYPPNQLCLAEALAAVDAAGESQTAYRRAEMLARALLAQGGSPDAADWLEEARSGAARGAADPEGG